MPFYGRAAAELIFQAVLTDFIYGEFWWHAYTRVPSRLSATLRQHETHTYTRYDSWRLASGGLGSDVVLINDRDLAEHTPLAHFTLNFDKRHRSTAHRNSKRLSCLIF